ncbi:glycosyltransferase [Glaciecola sp. 1036]|uniref:glycosyltransferase n=1 Tax=Alteromonadaceae TaxID=72275 RepID=UPI003CFC7113
MHKVNILHVTYDMQIGGTETVIKNIISSTDSNQYSHSIFCIEDKMGPWGRELNEAGIPVFMGNRQPGFDRLLIKKIRRLITSEKIDVVHCHQYTPWVYGCLAALGKKAKVIFTEHGRFHPDSSSWKRNLINPWLARATNHITSISKATKLALVEFENIPIERINVIYNGIDPLYPDPMQSEKFRLDHQVHPNDILLGTVARLDPIKNQLMMLEAFALASNEFSKMTLVIVGDGQMRDALEKKVESLGIKEKVIFTGYINNPINILMAIDVFLLSSLSEGTSMTLLEAMSLAKPCVVTDAGGNPEVIKDCETGFVTPNEDGVLFAQGITKLVQSPELIQAYGQAAKKRFDDYFSSQKMASEYQILYGSKN